MKTFIVAVLVVVVAILFYYPTFVQIPSTEEIKHQQASTPHAVSSPAAQPTTPTVTQAPSDVPPAAATASATALPTVAAAATAAAPASTVTASSTPAASTSASAPADNYAELPPLTGRKVIVVGGGLAGASAAIEALKAGAHVTIIEKTHKFGGNSEKASSGMNAARTAAQIKLSLKDSVEDFYKDTMASGHGLANPELVKVLTEQSASAYDFLTSFDINLSVVTKLGGHSRARTHRPKAPPPPLVPSNVGYDITSTLNRFLLERVPRKERLTVIASARVTELLVEDGRVVGVKYVSTRTSEGAQQAEQPVEVRADAVVLATGGYSRAQDLLAQYRPDLVDLPTTNGPFAEGDGIKIAEQINASVIHMDQVQIHPTSFILPSDPLAKTKFLAPEALRGLGGVLLNDEGKRFVNELDTRDHVSNAIFKHCQPLTVLQGPEDRQVEIKGPVRAYLIMIDEAVKEFPALKFYSLKGFVTAIPGYDELAEELGLPLENVKATLEAYNDCFVRQGHCNDPFGKKDFPYPTRYNDMYHVMQITPAIHYTMGGLEIDSEGRVLHAVPVAAEEGSSESEQHVVKEPIPGLFAAGEVTGGVHGANRLGGNSLLECVVFGRRAGRAAAASEASGSAQP